MRVRLPVLLETSPPASFGGPGQVLDANRGAHPAVARDIGRDRREVQALIGKTLTRTKRKEAIDPETGTVKVCFVAPHAVDLEPVGEAGDCLGLHKLAQDLSIVRRDALVSIERHDPVRLQVSGCREQAVAVRRVVPPGVRGPYRVLQDDPDQGILPENLEGRGCAAIVQGHHRVRETGHGLEVAGEIGCAVADWEQADQRR